MTLVATLMTAVSICAIVGIWRRQGLQTEPPRSYREHTRTLMLHEAEQAHRRMVQAISHEVRTPLATLSAHLERLSLAEGLSAAERREYVRIALGQVERLKAAVERSFAIGTRDVGGDAFNPEPMQVAELLHDVAEKTQSAARRARVALRVEHPDRVPLVLGDIRLLERALDDLLLDALRRTRRGGQVILRVSPHATAVRVEVQTRDADRLAQDHEGARWRDHPAETGASSGAQPDRLDLVRARQILRLHGDVSSMRGSQRRRTSTMFVLPVVDRCAAVKSRQAQRAIGSVHGDRH